MLIGSWWRLEWYIMHSRIISQISPTFGKIPRKFPEKFGNLVQISGIQSKFWEFSQDFGNLNWIFQWILRTFQWFEHYSKTLKYYWILQFTEILWNSSDSHWNSQPSIYNICICTYVQKRPGMYTYYAYIMHNSTINDMFDE